MSSQPSLGFLLRVTTDTDHETKHVSLVCFVPNYCYNFKIVKILKIILGSVFSFLFFNSHYTIFYWLLGSQKYNSSPRPKIAKIAKISSRNPFSLLPKKTCQTKLQLSESSKQANNSRRLKPEVKTPQLADGGEKEMLGSAVCLERQWNSRRVWSVLDR